MKQPAHTFVNLDDLTTPTEGDTVMVDRWWIITPENQAIIWRGFAPQCNGDESIAKDLAERIWPSSTVVHVPIAYVRLPYE